VYPKGGDIRYINETYEWLMKASTGGKDPPHWNEEVIWLRKNLADVRLEFEKNGRRATSLEELGLRFTPNPGQITQELL